MVSKIVGRTWEEMEFTRNRRSREKEREPSQGDHLTVDALMGFACESAYRL